MTNKKGISIRVGQRVYFRGAAHEVLEINYRDMTVVLRAVNSRDYNAVLTAPISDLANNINEGRRDRSQQLLND